MFQTMFTVLSACSQLYSNLLWGKARSLKFWILFFRTIRFMIAAIRVLTSQTGPIGPLVGFQRDSNPWPWNHQQYCQPLCYELPYKHYLNISGCQHQGLLPPLRVRRWQLEDSGRGLPLLRRGCHPTTRCPSSGRRQPMLPSGQLLQCQGVRGRLWRDGWTYSLIFSLGRQTVRL